MALINNRTKRADLVKDAPNGAAPPPIATKAPATTDAQPTLEDVKSTADAAFETATKPAAPTEPVTGGTKPLQPVTPPVVTPTPVTAPTETQPETVEDRLSALTSGDSKYVNLARSDAERSANKRGLINSAMAAGLGEEAAIRAALPIAQQDASAINEFGLNVQSADLNKSLASWNNMLDIEKIEFSETMRGEVEAMLANNAISNTIKTQALDQINQLMLSTEQIVLDIGLSDRTDDAQVAAIAQAYITRNANIAVWNDLLNSIPGYTWSADLTPADVTPPAPEPIPADVATTGNTWLDNYIAQSQQ